MSLAAAVAAVALPFGALWSNVAPAHGQVLVWGYANPGRGCVFLAVDPASLHSRLTRRGCSRTGRLAPDVTETTVRVGGRLAFRYQDASDTKPVWAYGGGSLWLYDVATARGPQLLRFDLHGGRLLQRVRFPRLFEPVLAADAAGAFLMANPSGGISGERSAALYFVGAGAHRPVVLRRGARAAFWMAAAGRTLWLETITGASTFTLRRYDGVRGRVLWRQSTPVVGGATFAAGGLWGVTPSCSGRIDVVRLDPGTGAHRVVARLPFLGCAAPGAAGFAFGSYWVVDGPELYRVTPRG